MKLINNKHIVILDNKELTLIDMCLVAAAKKTVAHYKEFIDHCKEHEDELNEDEKIKCEELLKELCFLNDLTYKIEGLLNVQ